LSDLVAFSFFFFRFFSFFWGPGAFSSFGPWLFSLFLFGGVVMLAYNVSSVSFPVAAVRSGFVCVAGALRSAPVVARRCGRLVWARRLFVASSCSSPAPACLFVPCRSAAAAGLFAGLVRLRLGWRTVARPGRAGSPVFVAVGLPVPVAAVKVCLPAGLSAAAARSELRGLACLAGVFSRA